MTVAVTGVRSVNIKNIIINTSPRFNSLDVYPPGVRLADGGRIDDAKVGTNALAPHIIVVPMHHTKRYQC